MHHIFIDTNIFLDFYRESHQENAPQKLNEILQKIQNSPNNYKIYLTDNLKDEFYRNRAKVLKDEYDSLNNKLKLTGLGIPTVIRTLELYTPFQESLNNLERAKQAMLNDFLEKSKNKGFEQDRFMEAFFNLNEIYKFNQDEKVKARDRYDFGYPPGKNKTYGDALNWLHLLDAVPENQSLYLVTRDNDFKNPLDPKELHPFLKQEWQDLQKGELYLIDSLNILFHTLDETDQEIEKSYISELIDALVLSGSFQNTHNIVAELTEYIDKFDVEQLTKIYRGFYSNPQFNWISTDTDIKVFLGCLTRNNNYSLESRLAIKNEYNNLNKDFPDD
ncbi:PIN domain-containing protein [Acinetobacter pittii]|uniref:PIN domain-containing protein n=1 Tax=Acinetobacter pittii TaxID=48296 RepID=UPI00254C1FEE|nr:PIN domain-containing protein [Acinetobacter pittii]MEC6001653.1 PIN domain-containing protein [Acinetobacter pittii]